MYAIAVLRNVYQPDLQGESQPGFHNDFHGNTVFFDTVEEAQAEIDKWESEVVVISNNEYARPDYIVVDERSADYIQGGRNSDMSNYDWDGWENFCNHEGGDACGECSGCIEHMINQDRAYIRSNKVTA